MEVRMSINNEIVVSATDAELLAGVVGMRGRDRREADASDALASMLSEARMVPHEALPGDRVAMNTRVTYREEPGGASRTVTLVHPSQADASKGRVSVLSPIGRALLGRMAGALSAAAIPGGRAVSIRVLRAERLGGEG
jgi:regulator of nucleoside diphosphate kinase